MNRDGRLSSVLHALLHLAARGEPMTSEELAACMRTHPVVVRRTLAGLREAGFLRSEKGRGGGWTIACDLRAVTLRDVHAALGEPALVATGLGDPATSCLVEQAVNAALGSALRDAEALLLERFATVTLASLAADFTGRLAAHRKEHHDP